MTDKVLNIFTKAELIEGIQSLSKYDGHRLTSAMLLEKEYVLIQELEHNGEKITALNEELNKAKGNGEKDKYWDIYAKICGIMNRDNKHIVGILNKKQRVPARIRGNSFIFIIFYF